MDVLFEQKKGVGGDIGLITLNRPQALNSLNAGMIAAMHQQLAEWSQSPGIKAVIIRATEGKAFCAGGDLREAYQCFAAKDPARSFFFRDEYQLNRLIYHYPKPYIALLDGITMGGGVGISIHGSHRVATEHLLFAMPETGIGFFPDVGGTYFLPRIQRHLGYFLGLTGMRLTSDDCVALGLTQQRVAQSSLTALVDAIAEADLSEQPKERVSRVINDFSVATKASSLIEQQDELEHCFRRPTIEDIIESLHIATAPLALKAASMLPQKSPTSLKVTLAALKRGAKLDFDTCMQQELRLACHFTDGHDFAEGIRAVIIDKDQAPQWQPATLAEVSPQQVEHFFSPSAQELA